MGRSLKVFSIDRISVGLVAIIAIATLGISCTKKAADPGAAGAPQGAATNTQPAPGQANAPAPGAPAAPANVFVPPGGFLIGVAPGNSYVISGLPTGKTFQDAMEEELKPGMTLAQLVERANAVVAETGMGFGIGVHSPMDTPYVMLQEANPAKKNSNIVAGPTQVNPCNRKVVRLRILNLKEDSATILTSIGKFEVKFSDDIRPRMLSLYQGDKRVATMPMSDLDHPYSFVNGTTPYSPIPLPAKYKEWWDKNMLAKVTEMGSGLAPTPHLMMTITGAGQIRFATDLAAYKPSGFASNPSPALTQAKPGSSMHTVKAGDLTVDISDYCVQPPAQPAAAQ